MSTFLLQNYKLRTNEKICLILNWKNYITPVAKYNSAATNGYGVKVSSEIFSQKISKIII